MYLTMILGESVVRNFNGQGEVFLRRYVDWAVTTPLFLLELGVIAELCPKLIAGMIRADLFTILTGPSATLEATPRNYLWWVISTGSFLAILGRVLKLLAY